MKSNRKIVHIDIVAFFASVEQERDKYSPPFLVINLIHGSLMIYAGSEDDHLMNEDMVWEKL